MAAGVRKSQPDHRGVPLAREGERLYRRPQWNVRRDVTLGASQPETLGSESKQAELGSRSAKWQASLPTTPTWGEPLDFSESYLPPNGDAQRVKGQNKCEGHCKRNDGFSGLVWSSSCPQTIPTCKPLSSPLLLSNPPTPTTHVHTLFDTS